MGPNSLMVVSVDPLGIAVPCSTSNAQNAAVPSLHWLPASFKRVWAASLQTALNRKVSGFRGQGSGFRV